MGSLFPKTHFLDIYSPEISGDPKKPLRQSEKPNPKRQKLSTGGTVCRGLSGTV